MTNPTTDNFDELAAMGHGDEPAATARALTDMVERNPLPAVLAAAAAGAGLMALVSLMARRDPNPLAPIPLVSPRGLDYEALKRQIADLADRLGDRVTSATRSASADAAKQRVGQASDAVADGWSSVRDQASDALAEGWGTVRDQAADAIDRLQPQATAAIKAARENPVWTALIVGVVGALLGSQLLGGQSTSSTGSQSDPSADA